MTDLAEAIRQAQAALDRDDVGAAWEAIGPLAGRIAQDREVAAAWLTLLRVSPGRPGLLADIKLIVSAFADDPQLVNIACDALIREAERVAPDEPPPEGGAAHTAVVAAQRCLELLDEQARNDAERMGYLQINLANALRLSHLHERAERAFKAALKRGPEHGWWWFNYSLLHKARRAFDECLEATEEARARLGDQKPLLWNLAISATALGQGKRAAEAYAKLGIACTVAASGMPQVDGLPPVQIRVATVGPGHAGPAPVPDTAVSFELLWVAPLSPCHGVVQTASYRQGSVDYGDVVLWDAVPVGTAEHAGRRVPRFPLLAVLRAGDEHRFRFVALQRKPGAIAPLEGELPGGGLLFVHRAGPEAATSELVYGKVVLPGDADLAEFRTAFDARLASVGDVELVMPGLLEALGDTPAAGKAHTMWRGLERTIEKKRDKR